MRLLTILFCLFSLSPAQAANSSADPVEQLQITSCLAAELKGSYPLLAENKQYAIIAIPASEVQKIALLADKANCGRFVNVSQNFLSKINAEPADIAKQLINPRKQPAILPPTSYTLAHPTAVIDAIHQVNVNNIMADLQHLTQYPNRSASSETGVATAKWLQQRFQQMVEQYQTANTASYFVNTGTYLQPSLVTVLGTDLHEPAIVLGAHMDTLDGNMPGAGDDGSGTASLLETARVLLKNPIKLKRPVYFIWYAAEERGLVGSQFVVDHFKNQAIPVQAVIQFDMTGFRNNPNDPTIWVYKDYTDPLLTDFIAKLLDIYVGVPVGESQCGYGCSDHASWTRSGIPAVFPCETDFIHHNPNIHTARDTLDRLTPEHMVNFSKLGLAFAIELAVDDNCALMKNQ